MVVGIVPVIVHRVEIEDEIAVIETVVVPRHELVVTRRLCLLPQETNLLVVRRRSKC